MTLRSPLAGLLAFLACPAVWSQTVRIQNPCGDVRVRTVTGTDKTDVQASRPEDVRITRELGVLLIQCRPAGKARVDLDVSVPYTANLQATTTSGAISIEGLIRDANLSTDDGGIRLSVPWQLMRVRVLSLGDPAQLTLPMLPEVEFMREVRDGYWTLTDVPRGYRILSPRPPGIGRGTPPRGWLFGSIQVNGKMLSRLDLIQAPLSKDSWVKIPERAVSVLDSLLAPPARSEPQRNDSRTAPGETPLFVSDVRMVSLSAGLQLRGLRGEDFEILEDGIPQQVAFAGAEELPFNLVLLLDFSTTTLSDRLALKEAARGFIRIARPQDRVAVYGLAEGYFQVISPLTADPARLAEVIDAMPPVGGTSPLYDAIVLACAQESLPQSQQRSALVIISDGIDNALHASTAGSKVPFEELLRVTAGTPVLMYPILLPPPSKQGPFGASPAVAAAAPLARRRMQQLADASGGRLFTADSMLDLRPVYEEVARELRSVYTLSYYPKNQNFDGKWRRVRARVKSPAVELRTREGYYAR